MVRHDGGALASALEEENRAFVALLTCINPRVSMTVSNPFDLIHRTFSALICEHDFQLSVHAPPYGASRELDEIKCFHGIQLVKKTRSVLNGFSFISLDLSIS